jgi:hypothetical protein
MDKDIQNIQDTQDTKDIQDTNNNANTQDITNYIDACIFNCSHFDIANVIHKFLKDKHRYVENNTWKYLKINPATGCSEWAIDVNNEQLSYSIRTIVCRAFTDRSLYWADTKESDKYPDTEIISNKLLNISSKLKDNKYICVLIKECKQFF